MDPAQAGARRALADSTAARISGAATLCSTKSKSHGVIHEREEIFQEHTQVTDAMSALATAAKNTHDTAALSFAEGAVADSLNDVELIEPMSILIGGYLRAKLPPGQ